MASSKKLIIYLMNLKNFLFNQIKNIMKKPEEGTDPNNPVRIYTDGIFDCFHYGHAKFLEQCKKMFPYVYLIVGLCSDEDISFEKWKPIMSINERAECLKHCKWCDEIMINVPWVCSIKFLDSINCKYIAHDPEPYPFDDIPDLYAPFKECGRFLPTKRTEGISTTDIIERILADYDMYIERNVRKGDKWDKLNISLYKYFAVRIVILVKEVEKRKNYNPKKFYFDIWNAKAQWMK